MTEPQELSLADIADRVEAGLGRAEQKLIDMGLAPPKRTRAQKRERRAGRRLPNDALPGQNREQVRTARKAKAKAARKSKRGQR